MPSALPEEFHSLGPIGRAAIVLLGISTVTHLASTISDWHTYNVVRDYLGGKPNVEDAALNSADTVARLTSIPNVIVSVAAAVVFVLWLWRARLNSEVFCRADHRHSHAWVLTSWICPGPNMVYPKQIVDDIWAASHRRTPSWTEDLKRYRRTGVTTAWWLCWVGAMLLDVVVRRVLMWVEPTVGSLHITAISATVALIFTGLSAVLATQVIRKITGMQTERPWIAWWDAEEGISAQDRYVEPAWDEIERAAAAKPAPSYASDNLYAESSRSDAAAFAMNGRAVAAPAASATSATSAGSAAGSAAADATAPLRLVPGAAAIPGTSDTPSWRTPDRWSARASEPEEPNRPNLVGLPSLPTAPTAPVAPAPAASVEEPRLSIQERFEKKRDELLETTQNVVRPRQSQPVAEEPEEKPAWSPFASMVEKWRDDIEDAPSYGAGSGPVYAPERTPDYRSAARKPYSAEPEQSYSSETYSSSEPAASYRPEPSYSDEPDYSRYRTSEPAASYQPDYRSSEYRSGSDLGSDYRSSEPAARYQPDYRSETYGSSEPSYRSERPQPEPTRRPEPTHQPEPTYQAEPTRRPEPSYQPQPTFQPEPARRPEPSYEPSYRSEPEYGAAASRRDYDERPAQESPYNRPSEPAQPPAPQNPSLPQAPVLAPSPSVWPTAPSRPSWAGEYDSSYGGQSGDPLPTSAPIPAPPSPPLTLVPSMPPVPPADQHPPARRALRPEQQAEQPRYSEAPSATRQPDVRPQGGTPAAGPSYQAGQAPATRGTRFRSTEPDQPPTVEPDPNGPRHPRRRWSV